MTLREEIQSNERTFPGTPNIKYYFKPSSNQAVKKLLIGFSGFHGKEKDGIPPSYNYIKHLRYVDVNQLYILDGNNKNVPLYYIGENGSNNYEEKVIQLILYICKREEIPLSNIITFGSSKGGTAAAYFAMKYSLGHFISGGMQTRAGDYLKGNNNFTRDVILTTIAGNKEPERILNNRLMSIFDNPIKNTNYYLHGGRGDSHYLNYVKPFHNLLDSKNVPYRLDIAEYSNHSEIGSYFLPFLISSISEIFNIPIIKEFSLDSVNNEIILDIKLHKSIRDSMFAVYMIDVNSNEVIKKLPYQRNTNFNIKTEAGTYRFRIYTKKGDYKSRYNTGSIEIK